jgi:hypothetical protein
VTSYSVFVLPPDMKPGSKEKDGDKYYKMLITSIRVGEGVTWVVGRWMYSAADVRSANPKR